MQKLTIFILSITMLLVFSHTTLASTMPVQVDEGLSFGVGKVFTTPSNDNITINGSYGLNENLLLSVSYSTPSGSLGLGGRYAFSENAAFVIEYTSLTSGGITQSLLASGGRYKFNASEQLAIVGEVDLVILSLSYGGLIVSETFTVITGQAEYKISDLFIVNGGVAVTTSSSNSATSLIIGGELKPIEQLTAGLDYMMPSSGGNGSLVLQVTYSLK